MIRTLMRQMFDKLSLSVAALAVIGGCVAQENDVDPRAGTRLQVADCNYGGEQSREASLACLKKSEEACASIGESFAVSFRPTRAQILAGNGEITVGCEVRA